MSDFKGFKHEIYELLIEAGMVLSDNDRTMLPVIVANVIGITLDSVSTQGIDYVREAMKEMYEALDASGYVMKVTKK